MERNGRCGVEQVVIDRQIRWIGISALAGLVCTVLIWWCYTRLRLPPLPAPPPTVTSLVFAPPLASAPPLRPPPDATLIALSGTPGIDENTRSFSYCIDGSDFSIEHRDILLKTRFTESGLRSYFSRFLDHNGEVYATVSTDADFLKRLADGAPTRYDSDIRVPVQTDAPLAYFYKVGKSSFFQYRDETGRVAWVTLQGDNLYDRFLSGHLFTLRGFGFVGSYDNRTCKALRRELSFIVDSLRKMTFNEIRRAVEFYDKKLPYPPGLLLHFDNTLTSANEADFGFKLPYLGTTPPDAKYLRSVSYFRIRGNRLLRVYDDRHLVHTDEW